MQELKATQAREIDKASVTEAESLAVNGALPIALSESTMQAGDFYFRPNVVTTIADAPTGFFKRLAWRINGSPLRTKDSAVYSVVISCPFCGMPIITGPSHRVASMKPLTITGAIACPYSAQNAANAHAFRITEGNITAI